jgi:dCTP diphosphatase
LIYLIRLADVLDVDLRQAVDQKIASNAKRHPIELAKGSAVKHDRRTS